MLKRSGSNSNWAFWATCGSRMFERCGVFFPVDHGCLRGVACDFFVRILRVIFYWRILRVIFYVRILTWNYIFEIADIVESGDLGKGTRPSWATSKIWWSGARRRLTQSRLLRKHSLYLRRQLVFWRKQSSQQSVRKPDFGAKSGCCTQQSPCTLPVMAGMMKKTVEWWVLFVKSPTKASLQVSAKMILGKQCWICSQSFVSSVLKSRGTVFEAFLELPLRRRNWWIARSCPLCSFWGSWGKSEIRNTWGDPLSTHKRYEKGPESLANRSTQNVCCA